jgi:hypothetical protein
LRHFRHRRMKSPGRDRADQRCSCRARGIMALVLLLRGFVVLRGFVWTPARIARHASAAANPRTIMNETLPDSLRHDRKGRPSAGRPRPPANVSPPCRFCSAASSDGLGMTHAPPGCADQEAP